MEQETNVNRLRELREAIAVNKKQIQEIDAQAKSVKIPVQEEIMKLEDELVVVETEIMGYMHENGIVSEEVGEYKVSLQRNPWKTVITNEAIVPPEFIRTKQSFDMNAIKKLLSDGQELPFAEKEEGTERLVLGLANA